MVENDSRDEFRQFLAAFGAEKAAEYYANGLSFEEAMKIYSEAQKQELSALRAKLSRKPGRGMLEVVRRAK